MKTDIVIICAMESEFEAVISSFSSRSEVSASPRRIVVGSCGGVSVAAVLAGIGKVNAASATEYALAAFGAATVASVGVCGGLREKMSVFDLFAVGSAVEYDFDLSEIDQVPIGQLEDFSSRYLPMTVPDGFAAEVIATGDHFNDSDRDDHLLIDDINAGLRDMECAAVAHVALRHGVRAAALKCVTDVRGKGSMVGQYADNLARANAILANELSRFVAALGRI